MRMPLQLLSEKQLQTLRMQQRTSTASAASAAVVLETDEESGATGLSAPLLAKRGVCAAALWARAAGYRHWFWERVAVLADASHRMMAWLRQHAYEPLASCDTGSDDEERGGARTGGFRAATEDEICEKNAALTVRHERYLTTHACR